MRSIKEILDQAREYGQTLPPLPEGAGQLVQPVNRYLDSAIHKPDSTADEVRKLCAEALEWQIAGVYTNPVYLPLVVKSIKRQSGFRWQYRRFPVGRIPYFYKGF